MDLQTLWFVLIAVLWGGYFLLEGFDFGVGMLLPFLPRDERERREMFQTIGPVWDGNEVWLVTAGGATFAAFPSWYATMFSGVGLANLLYGVPINPSGDFSGDFWDLFSAYTVVAGLAVVLVFAFHGATFLTLRTTGELCERAAGAARRLSVAAAAVGAAFLVWTVVVAVDNNDKNVFWPVVPAALAIAALILAVLFVYGRRSGWAFVMTATGVVLAVATLFTSLYPRVMVSSTDFGNSLTVDNASSAHYTLEVMSIVALICLPLILLYQGWTYHVFRARVGGEEVRPPTEALARPSDSSAS